MRGFGQIATWALVTLQAGCSPAAAPAAPDVADPRDGAVVEAGRPPDAATPLVFSCGGAGRCRQPFCEQVAIPPGVFPMGSDSQPSWKPYLAFHGLTTLGDETPQHPVYLDAFCIDRYEVTYERYLACVEAGACTKQGSSFRIKAEDVREVLKVAHYPPRCGKGAQVIQRCPHRAINCKRHLQAEAYCQWIGRRLCREAEWERAANGPGPAKRAYPWGDPGLLGAAANLPAGAEIRYVEQVDERPLGASAEGVLGLIGNVFEWVSDYYTSYQPAAGGAATINPHGLAHGTYRIARGGCAFACPLTNATTRVTFHPQFDWG